GRSRGRSGGARLPPSRRPDRATRRPAAARSPSLPAWRQSEPADRETPARGRRSVRAPDRRGSPPAPSPPSPRDLAPFDSGLRSSAWWGREPGYAPLPWLPDLCLQRAPSHPSAVPPPLPSPSRCSQDNQVVPMDDLVEPLVAERLLDLLRLRATILSKLSRVVVHQSARKFLSVELGQRHDCSRGELPLPLGQPGRQQALPSFS